MQCPVCGAQLRATAKFCATCGSRVQVPADAWAPSNPAPVQAPPVQRFSNSSVTVCPNCASSDAVATAARANLSAPPQPPNTAVKIVKIMRIIFGAAFGLITLALLCMVGGTVLTAGIAGTADTTGFSTALLGTSLVPLLCLTVFGLGFMGLILLLVPWLVFRYVDQGYQRQYAQWQKATDKWNRMYYCSRCAGVFMEGQNRLVPLEQMRSFLYEIESTPVPLLHGI